MSLHIRGSTSLYYISLLSGLWNIDDQHRNTNMNNKDRLVGQLTGGGKGVKFPGRPSLPNVSVSLAYKEAAWKENRFYCFCVNLNFLVFCECTKLQTITNGIHLWWLKVFVAFLRVVNIYPTGTGTRKKEREIQFSSFNSKVASHSTPTISFFNGMVSFDRQ